MQDITQLNEGDDVQITIDNDEEQTLPLTVKHVSSHDKAVLAHNGRAYGNLWAPQLIDENMTFQTTATADNQTYDVLEIEVNN